MSEQMQREPQTQDGTALGASLAQKIREIGDNVSREIEHARAEINERAEEGKKGLRLLAGTAPPAPSPLRRPHRFRSSPCAA